MQRQEMVGILEAMEVAELSKKPFGHGVWHWPWIDVFGFMWKEISGKVDVNWFRSEETSHVQVNMDSDRDVKRWT